jgi:hypothetical protein
VSKLDELKAQAVELQRKIALIESYKEGDQWQLMRISPMVGYWLDGIPSWDFAQYDFRKKPEPVVIYCNKYHAPGIGYYWRAYCGIDECRALAPKGAIEIAVKFVEVTE